VQNGWLNDNATYLRDLIQWGETARHRAVTDELTGLHNRSFLEESINGRFKYGAVGARKISLIMIDMDKVHEINERYGPAGGDKVIIATAGILKSMARSGDIAARLSGDEFAVMLPDTAKEGAVALAEEIRKNVSLQTVSVQRPNSVETDELHIKISLGIAIAPDHADNTRDLLFTADEALRKAKELGRNQVAVYGLSTKQQ
jgi:diguanylate cyclase (GGDEF)-like protein